MKSCIRGESGSLVKAEIVRNVIMVLELTYNLDSERKERLRSFGSEYEERLQFCEVGVSDPLTEEFTKAKNKQNSGIGFPPSEMKKLNSVIVFHLRR